MVVATDAQKSIQQKSIHIHDKNSQYITTREELRQPHEQHL